MIAQNKLFSQQKVLNTQRKKWGRYIKAHRRAMEDVFLPLTERVKELA